MKKKKVSQATLDKISDIVNGLEYIDQPDYSEISDLRSRINKVIAKEYLTKELLNALKDTHKAICEMERAFDNLVMNYEEVESILNDLEFGDEK